MIKRIVLVFCLFVVVGLIFFVTSINPVFSIAASTKIHEEKSLYRNIVVYDKNGLRCLSFGQFNLAKQTCMRLNDPHFLELDYVKMLMGALYLKPVPQKVLMIGMGGGTLPATLQRLYPNASIDVVEIDPAVVQVAYRFFNFTPGKHTQVITQDGRVFVKRALKQGLQYDLVMLDAFDHVYIPEHLTTLEFFNELKALMRDDGVLAANTFSTSRLYHAESATYQAAFGTFYNLRRSNRVLLLRKNGLLSQAELDHNAALLEKAFQPLGVSQAWLLPLFSSVQDWPAGTRVLTDQYSPANLLTDVSKAK